MSDRCRREEQLRSALVCGALLPRRGPLVLCETTAQVLGTQSTRFLISYANFFFFFFPMVLFRETFSNVFQLFLDLLLPQLPPSRRSLAPQRVETSELSHCRLDTGQNLVWTDIKDRSNRSKRRNELRTRTNPEGGLSLG